MKSKRAREATEPEGNHVDPVEVEAPSKKRKRTGDEDSADLKKAKKDKKEKKAKKDKKHQKESRKERKEKRKDLLDLPEQDDDEVDEKVTPATNGGVAEDSPMADAASQPAAAPADAADSEKSAKRDKKKQKKEKKEKKLKGELQDTDAAANEDAENPPSTGDKKKKKKKDKKSSQDDSTTTNTDADAEAGAEADADADAADSSKKDRHIVFVGNLPFTATAATIEAHFSSLSPASVRCMSDPNSDKPCRGFAFVEFTKVWHMRTCLDKFHHSMFNDEVSPPRRINVELTAGGGGKTKKRQDKIIEKNRKLDENRTKRIEREKNVKEENKTNGNGNSATAQQQHMEDNIHPSRRGRVPGEY